MTIGTFFVNRDGIVVSAHGGIAEFLGYSNLDIVGRRISTILHVPEDSITSQFQWLCDLPPLGTRLAGKHRTEGEMPLEICPFRADANSELIGLASAPVKVDQTSLRYSRKIVAMFTHDLRTPLNSILGFVQLLEMGTYGAISAQSLTSLRIAQRNVLKVLKLVDELLDFEKLDSGYSYVAFDKVMISDVVNQAVEANEQAASAKDILIQTNVKNLAVMGDAEQLFRVVLNLLENAIKFSPARSSVSIKCEAVGERLELEVSDCGSGISREFHKAIFEPFFQISPSKTVDRKGVGLGLSVCKAVVELHGGKIGVISESGSGSVFWVQLPLHSEADKAPVVIPMNLPVNSVF
jgi:signal transduction histidine kinase